MCFLKRTQGDPTGRKTSSARPSKSFRKEEKWTDETTGGNQPRRGLSRGPFRLRIRSCLLSASLRSTATPTDDDVRGAQPPLGPSPIAQPPHRLRTRAFRQLGPGFFPRALPRPLALPSSPPPPCPRPPARPPPSATAPPAPPRARAPPRPPPPARPPSPRLPAPPPRAPPPPGRPPSPPSPPTTRSPPPPPPAPPEPRFSISSPRRDGSAG